MTALHAAERFEFAPPAPKGLVRGLGIALLAHAFLLAALTWGVNWKTNPQTASAEAELWSAVPQEAAPKLVEPPPVAPTPPLQAEPPTPPAPPKPAKPAPAPVAEPEAPKADIVLAKEKLRLKKEKLDALEAQRLAQLKLEKAEKVEKLRLEKQDKLKQDRLNKEKALIEAKKKSALEAKRKEALKAEQEQLENQKIEIQREANLKRIAGLAGATGGAEAKGSAQKSSGTSAGYSGRLAALFRKNINFPSPESLSGNPKATVEVRVSATGFILSSRLLSSSGVTAWDNAVLRAVEKTERIPADENGSFVSVFPVNFGPKD